MKHFKIYTNDHKVLQQVCKDYNITVDYTFNPAFSSDLKDVFGHGYCCSDNKHLKVFCEGSWVDIDKGWKDITSQYIKPNFTL